MMVQKRIEQPDCTHGFVFDGLPGTVAQARYLMSLVRQNVYKPALVVHFVIDPKLLLRRITGKRMCKVGGGIYNIYRRPPQCGLPCEQDGRELEQTPGVCGGNVGPRLWGYEIQTESRGGFSPR